MSARPRATRSGPWDRRLVAAAVGVTLAGGLLAGAGAARSDPAYPPGDAGYHAYDEIAARLRELALRHPGIVEVHSFGRSAEGRDLWVARISDDVTGPDDPAEPEVLFDGLHHAREHLSAEVALSIVELLAGRYGDDDPLGRRVTRLVDTRVIWVVPALNPDGLAWDLAAPSRSYGPDGASWYAGWRKNRQPLPGSGAVGIDLNRSWGAFWGCCGGSSSVPSSVVYRGPRPWAAPEVRALRDLVRSRATDGRQRIVTHVSFHAAGEQVLYPWAHTTRDAGGSMTGRDLRTFRRIAGRLAHRAGFRPRQSSAMYVTDGDMIDWMYDEQRIFSLTVELPPATPAATDPDLYYPPDERLPSIERRVRGLILDTIELAGCPYRLIGAGRAWCGPFADDAEADRGWVADPDGTDTAADGAWARGDPTRDPSLRTRAADGVGAWLTGPGRGHDVDGGTTTLRSPWIALPDDASATIHLRWWAAIGAGAGATDGLVVRIVARDGLTDPLERIVLAGDTAPSPRWRSFAIDLGAAYARREIALELVARDDGPDDRVEVAIDDVRIVTDPA